MSDKNCSNSKEELNKILNQKESKLLVNDKMELIRLKDKVRNLSVCNFEKDYIYALMDCLINGIESDDRTNVGTIRQPYGQMLAVINEIPLLRGKKIGVKSAFVEAMWILLGRTDNKFLIDNGVKYWEPWLKPEIENGEGYGKIYGHQMRNQNGFDQLLYVIKKLHKSPNSRQAVINLWHGADLDEQVLPCCHVMYHPLIIKDKYLTLHITQRSGDSFLGIPYDYMLFYFIGTIISYLLDVTFIATRITVNDFHIYQNQLPSINEYLENVLYDKEQILKNFNLSKSEIDLNFPNRPDIETLTSESLTNWLQELFELNKDVITKNTYHKNYPAIKTPIAV